VDIETVTTVVAVAATALSTGATLAMARKIRARAAVAPTRAEPEEAIPPAHTARHRKQHPAHASSHAS